MSIAEPTWQATVVQLQSPGGLLTVDAALDDRGRLTLTARTPSATICEVGPLGLDTSLESIADGLSMLGPPTTGAYIDSFDLPTGKTHRSEFVASAATLRLASKDTPLELTIEILAADHCLAWRSRLDGTDAAVTIIAEHGDVCVEADAPAWIQHHQAPALLAPAYEGWYENGTRVADLPATETGWSLPALLHTADHWLLVTEAGLSPGHAGSHLSHQPGTARLKWTLPSVVEGLGHGDPLPGADLPVDLPWRVLQISDSLAGIVESNAIRHLNPPADPNTDWSWVLPGRVAWSWWSDHDSPTNPDALRRFIDGASTLGWEYLLVDANWNTMPDDTIEGLAADAAERDVGLMLWYNSGGPNNEVTEQPRDLMTTRDIRRTEMARIAGLGIAGIKVDFFLSDKPATIAQYIDILNDAADYKLLVNFHGCTAPRGWSRTYPHLMTTEAVRGAEWYRLSDDYGGRAPTHNTILPFTRNVVGSMDYTPGVLSDRAIARHTSDVHELALGVVFESALLHWCDDIDAYLDQPKEVIDFLAGLPTTWDETLLLDGHPGHYVAIARRHHTDWYIAAINATPGNRAIALDLDRLGLHHDAPVTILADDPERPAIHTQTVPVNTFSGASLVLGPGGGLVAVTNTTGDRPLPLARRSTRNRSSSS